jgi:hypothetical protein
MKKLLFLLILLITLPVRAEDNRLYFVEGKDSDKVYYESGLFDSKKFMSHLDMVPGSSYTDTLVIENSTNTKYTLYFKFNKKSQSQDAENLLNNIIMKITINGNVIYEGKANGMGSLDLTDAVLLGDVLPKTKYNMVVNTYLSTEYTNPQDDDLAKIDWTFYAQYDREPPREIVPITGSDRSNNIVIIAIILIVLASLIAILYKYVFNKKAN